jgi:hypothetical protein
VAGAGGVFLVAEPDDPGAFESHEDLLLGELAVDGRGPPARLHLQERDADPVGADRVAEVDPRQPHRAPLEDTALDIVPVGDHDSSRRIACAPRQSTSSPIVGRCSSPSTTLANTLPASWPALLAKHVSP